MIFDSNMLLTAFEIILHAMMEQNNIGLPSISYRIMLENLLNDYRQPLIDTT